MKAFIPDVCPRCGKNHNHNPVENVKEFKKPVKVEGEVFEYWVMCPNVNEPILIQRGCVEEYLRMLAC